MAKAKKTNVMRILDQHKIAYEEKILPDDYEVNHGEDIALALGIDPNKQFKTLVTQGKSKDYFVFLVPVNKELDLKAAAESVNEKNVHMIPQKDLEPLTGYVHGGCSPIGMKKEFVTVIDDSALNYESITFSAGKRGFLLEAPVAPLKDVIKDLSYAPIMTD